MNFDLKNSVLMQYQTPLPDDYDLNQLHQRIGDLKAAFDQFPGLFFKLYVVNDLDSAPLREYSSIYLWQSPAAMASFLTGDRFYSYVHAFARPPVRSWLPRTVAGQLDEVAKARFAIRQTVSVPRLSHPGEFLKGWEKRTPNQGALLQVTAFDPACWELTTLSLWEHQPSFQWKAELYTLVATSLPLGKF